MYLKKNLHLQIIINLSFLALNKIALNTLLSHPSCFRLLINTSSLYLHSFYYRLIAARFAPFYYIRLCASRNVSIKERQSYHVAG